MFSFSKPDPNPKDTLKLTLTVVFLFYVLNFSRRAIIHLIIKNSLMLLTGWMDVARINTDSAFVTDMGKKSKVIHLI